MAFMIVIPKNICKGGVVYEKLYRFNVFLLIKNAIHFCSIFFELFHGNMVSISMSRSKSRSIRKLVKGANCTIVVCFCTKIYLNGKKCYMRV